MLRIQKLSKCYRKRTRTGVGELWALRDVSFDVDAGTVVGIVGASGSGKTTLLRVVGGMSPPTEGRVIGRGRIVPLLELGSLFQGDLSGRENVLWNAALLGIPEEDVAEQLDAIFEFAGLSRFSDVPVKRYSTGMALRLAFSLAVNLDPDILLVDDLFGVGDLDFQERCVSRVGELAEEGVAVLLASQDANTLLRLCNRVVWLSSGQVVMEGEPERVLEEYLNAAWAVVGLGRMRSKGGHANRYGQILWLKPVDASGNEIAKVWASEDLFLELGFKIARPGVRVRCAMDFFTRGQFVFRTVQPREMSITATGTYSATVRIPAGLMAESAYGVNATVNIVDKGREYPIVAPGALSFRVMGSARADATGWLPRSFPSLVSPELEWETGRQRDLVVG